MMQTHSVHVSITNVTASGKLIAFSSTHSRKLWSYKLMVEQGHERNSSLKKARAQMDTNGFQSRNQLNKPSIQSHQNARCWNSSNPAPLVLEMRKEQSSTSNSFA